MWPSKRCGPWTETRLKSKMMEHYGNALSLTPPINDDVQYGLISVNIILYSTHMPGSQSDIPIDVIAFVSQSVLLLCSWGFSSALLEGINIIK